MSKKATQPAKEHANGEAVGVATMERPGGPTAGLPGLVEELRRRENARKAEAAAIQEAERQQRAEDERRDRAALSKAADFDTYRRILTGSDIDGADEVESLLKRLGKPPADIERAIGLLAKARELEAAANVNEEAFKTEDITLREMAMESIRFALEHVRPHQLAAAVHPAAVAIDRALYGFMSKDDAFESGVKRDAVRKAVAEAGKRQNLARSAAKSAAGELAKLKAENPDLFGGADEVLKDTAAPTATP